MERISTGAHERLIAPHWSRIRAVLDADVAYRAKQLTTGGAERLFADLHPDPHWCDGRLMLREARPRTERAVNRGPGGPVLMPVVLGSPYVLIKKNTSAQTTVRYPARGVGALWAGGRRGPRVARSDYSAGSGRTTRGTEIPHNDHRSRSLGVTPSAVSQHLPVSRYCWVTR
jgi:hypothetical protein